MKSLQTQSALIAVGGTRQADGTMLIDGESHPWLPQRQITVEGVTFDFFSEEEEGDARNQLLARPLFQGAMKCGPARRFWFRIKFIIPGLKFFDRGCHTVRKSTATAATCFRTAGKRMFVKEASFTRLFAYRDLPENREARPLRIQRHKGQCSSVGRPWICSAGSRRIASIWVMNLSPFALTRKKEYGKRTD